MAGPAIRTIRAVMLLVVLVCLIFVAAFYFWNSTSWKRNSLIATKFNLFNRKPHTESNEDLARFFHLNPNTDNSTHRSVVEEVQNNNPNLPIAFWNDHRNKQMYYKNKSCANFPNIFDMNYSNKHWQTLETTNGTFQLYGAYYEIRDLSSIKPAVRILGMINRFEPTVKTYCQFWFSHLSEPVFGEVEEYSYMWFRSVGHFEEEHYQPYLMVCKIPSEHQKEVPASVSLVEKPCDSAFNHLRVIYNKSPKKDDFAVCVKGLDLLHNDLSVRLVEWIEVLHALGAKKIFFYELNVHPNISKVLQHYKQLGKVDVTPHTLTGDEPNLPGLQHMYLTNKINRKRQNELIPYNDCFYKNIYSYRYVTLLDIDEVIIPVEVGTWKELLDSVEAKALAEKNETRVYYQTRNVYFFDDYPEEHGWFEGIPRYMHMMQHVYRTKNFTKPGAYVKSFFHTERALTLHNNHPFSSLIPRTSYSIPTSDAQLQHYRPDCVPELGGVCEEFRKNFVIDTNLWKFKDSVIEATINTLKKLGFFDLK